MLAVLLAASEEGSYALFYTAGIVLAAFAVLISVAGLLRSRFPESGARLVMALGAVLVAFTMAASVISSA